MSELVLSPHDKDWPRLRPVRGMLQSAFAEARDIVDPYLSLDGINFTAVYGANKRLPVGGVCEDGHNVHLRFSTDDADFNPKTLRSHLPLIVAHETHHALRMQKLGFARTRGDMWVMEGLGVAAELDVGKGRGLDDYSFKESWLRVVLQEAHIDRGLPLVPRDQDSHEFYNNFWINGGYHLGLHFVRNYQRANGNPTAAELVHTPADEILKATFG